jgi:glutathione S-transferase
MSTVPKAVLYYDPRSTWSLAVLLALEEKGYGKDEIDLKLVDLSKGENFSPSFLRINPTATVPTMVVPFENTLSADMESRYKAITDTEAIIAFLDKSRSIMSHTHTTSAAPAPALSPATVSLSATAKSIIALVHSSPASPELLFYFNARDSATLKTVSPSVSTFLKGRKTALEHYLAENETKEIRVSEKTKKFWQEKKNTTEELLVVLDEADKSESELSEEGKKAREGYFESTKAAWELGLALVLNKLSDEIVGPFTLGEQISIADVHIAAWLHELVTLSGGTARDKGIEAISKLEEHVGGGFALAKGAAPAVSAGPRPNPITSGTATETPTAAKLVVLWDALSERPSWQKAFGVKD